MGSFHRSEQDFNPSIHLTLTISDPELYAVISTEEQPTSFHQHNTTAVRNESHTIEEVLKFWEELEREYDIHAANHTKDELLQVCHHFYDIHAVNHTKDELLHVCHHFYDIHAVNHTKDELLHVCHHFYGASIQKV